MGITNLRHSLEKRYAALTGQLEHTREKIERIKREVEQLAVLEQSLPDIERQIVNVRNTLQDVYPDWEPASTAPLRPWTHHIPIPFGECGRRGMGALRQSDQPMTVRQVARQVLSDCGTPEPDRETLKRVQQAIESSFRKFNGRTVESSGKYPKQWRAINKPEIEWGP